MRERVKLKLSLLYCTVESVESVLGSVEPTFKPTSRRRAYSCTSRHRAYVEASSLDTLRNWIMESLYEHRADASRCVEGSVELYIELYIEDVEARTQPSMHSLDATLDEPSTSSMSLTTRTQSETTPGPTVFGFVGL